MEYGRLIGDAYRIALRNRGLWPFGVFAGTAGFSFNFQFDTGDESFGLDPDVGLLLVLLAVAVALALGAVVLSVLSQGALAESVAAISRGQERGFRQALRAGRTAFWRTAGLYLLIVLLALAVMLVLALVAGGAVVATFAATDAPAVRVAVAILAVLAAIAALVLLMFPLLLVHQHAVRRLVLDGARPVAALRGGFGVLRVNIAASILLFLIQQGLALAAYTAIALITVILFGPALVVLIATDAGTAGIVLAAVTAVVAIPAALTAAGVVGTFGHGLWTLGYLEMTGPGSD